MPTSITARELLLLERRYQEQAARTNDPVWLIDRKRDEDIQERHAFLVACFSYGNRKVFTRTLRPLLERPELKYEDFETRNLSKVWKGFSYRFHTEAHLKRVLRWLQHVEQQHGSLGGFAMKLYAQTSKDPDAPHASLLLSRLSLSLQSESVELGYLCDTTPLPKLRALRVDPATRSLFSAPVMGSACKRPLMFLRWMVRKATPDLGLWTPWFRPSYLRVPLDTHLWQFAKAFGWTTRSSPSFAASEDVTKVLRDLDPEDPVRFDYALCSFGAELARTGTSTYAEILKHGVRAFLKNAPSHPGL